MVYIYIYPWSPKTINLIVFWKRQLITLVGIYNQQLQWTIVLQAIRLYSWLVNLTPPQKKKRYPLPPKEGLIQPVFLSWLR